MLAKKIVYVGEKFFECWWNSYVGEKSTFAMLANNWKAFLCMLVNDVGENGYVSEGCWWKVYAVEKRMLVKNFGNVGEGYVGEEKNFHVC